MLPIPHTNQIAKNIEHIIFIHKKTSKTLFNYTNATLNLQSTVLKLADWHKPK